MGFLIFLASIILLIIQYLVAKEFYNVAVAKGYTETKYLWISFLLGMVGYLLVIALPVRETSSSANTTVLTEKMITNDSVTWMCPKCNHENYKTTRFCANCGNEWKCEKCGAINSIFVTTCGCGADMPR